MLRVEASGGKVFFQNLNANWITSYFVSFSGFTGHHSKNREREWYVQLSLIGEDKQDIPVIEAEIPVMHMPFFRPVFPCDILS